MHQIRRHLRHISHPIIGDTRYGDNKHNRFFREHFGCRRLLLAATELTFTHPFSNAAITIPARLDKAFGAVVRRFGWQQSLPSSWLS